MSGDDFDFEPELGLPARLPEGERVLWKGAPAFRGLAIRAFHARKVAVYFLALALWKGISAHQAGLPGPEVASRAGGMLVFGAAAVGILCLIAWGYARTTVYTLTNRRVVMRTGIALPITVNLPFARIDGAGLRLHADGTGDIPLTPNKADRVPAIYIWPSMRPWRLARPEPMLRSVPDAVHVAALLTAALKGQAAPAAAGRPAAGEAAGLPQPA